MKLDEIHIKPKISYQAGQIVGSADNQKEEAATRIQAFMISSFMSKNKDIVSLVSVAKMTGDYLFELITKVIINVTNAGFTVNSVISDNNVINRKAFMLLSKTNSLQSYFLNPLGPHNETLSNWQGTALFIDYILKFWNIFNVKTTVEGIHKRLPDCDPIRSINSHQMIWMVKFVSWLQSWKLYSMNHSNSFLPNETFIALSHTVKTILVMIHDLLQHHNLKYILLSKFQTDNLEGRFGLYRQLSGCNYLVSVKYVMYSERKLKIKGLLRLFSSSKGVLTVSDFIASFSDIKTNKQDSSFIEYFPYCDMDTEIKDVSELLMVTGFVAKRTITYLTCITCKSKLGCVGKPIDLFVDEQSNHYFNLINRGGLTYPTNMLFKRIQYAYLIFMLCISTLEADFLKVSNQKQTYLGVVEQFITENDNCKDVHVVCEHCGVVMKVIVMKALSNFANTLLNNYSKDKCEDIITSNVSRKLAKFD